MVGRGWWLLVLIVCVAWMVCCVCAGLSCQKGQEFYNSQDGQCVPCTRCQDPLVVVVPCYVYRDAVCAPAINFFPNLSQHNGPQAPITLSTPTSVQNASSDVHGHERQTSSFRKNKPYLSSEFEKTHDYDWDKDSLLFSRTFRNSSSGNLPNSESNHRKHRKSHSKHRHRHKSGVHTSHKKHNVKSLAVSELDSEMKSDGVSHTSGANKSVLGLSDFGDRNSRLPNVNISDGANSDKDQNSDLKEAGISHWQNIFFLMTVIVISVCVVVLICIILSQLRNSFIRRKLKRVSDEAPVENNSEAAVMAQLLPADHGTTRLSSGTFSVNRSTISENRCSNHLPISATSIPSSPSTARRQADIESEQATGQMYPPIPFTMDRLLEQRRVMGPSTSVDTNLYIESWQQADSQAPTQWTLSVSPVLATNTFPPSESVSACPSPVPLRTYRLGPASASASPIVAVRGLGSRMALRGLLPMSIDSPSNGSREVVLNSRT
ncbi:uncharacterized protein wgn isoform X1 [Macrobrachium rosenbergii]|uniref:uncharacterized protein wgn isoform X1 n=1 Tax=Macrobrachium rosenbergii TaxID=79674 RepID=UPI0034D4F770